MFQLLDVFLTVLLVVSFICMIGNINLIEYMTVIITMRNNDDTSVIFHEFDKSLFDCNLLLVFF